MRKHGERQHAGASMAHTGCFPQSSMSAPRSRRHLMNFHQAATSGSSAADPANTGGDAIVARISSPIELHAYVMRPRRKCLSKRINMTDQFHQLFAITNKCSAILKAVR